MNRKRFLLAVLVALVIPAPGLIAQTPGEADHEELRGMMRAATQALNARQIDALAPLMARQFIITAVDGQTFHDLSGFKAYIDQLYGTRVREIRFRPEAEELTRFLDADTGLSWGKSTDTYTFRDGDSRTMTSHWTAVVQKQDGRWKLAALHISANVLDNPLLEAAKRYAWIMAGAALLIGMILGFIVRAVTARRVAP
jgi:uncharacterized protein (TIGR02246 family)